MTPIDRAGQFLLRLAQSEQIKTTVHARPTSELGKKLVGALKVAVPALALSAAAHAQSPSVAQMVMQINDGETFTVESVKDRIAVAQGYDSQALDNMRQINACLTSYAPADTTASVEMVLATINASAKVNEDISHWAKNAGAAPGVGVAAFCVDPLNWQAKANEFLAMTNKYPPTIAQSLRDNLTTHTIASAYSRAETLQYAVLDAADAQNAYQKLYGAPAIKVGGMDWVSAASGIVQGVSNAMGDQSLSDSARSAERLVRDGDSYRRRGESVFNRRDKSSVARGVGDMVKQAGQRVGRATRTPSYRYR